MGIRKCVCRQVHGLMNGAMSMARGCMPAALAGGRCMPAMGDEVNVDICEGMDDIVVVADLPGTEKENIVVRLCSPTELWISGARCSQMVDIAGGGEVVHRELTCGRMHRRVSFPSDATAGGATASYENGVLTVRLAKVERGERIPIT